EPRGELIDPSQIAARPMKTVDDPALDWIVADRKNNRNRRGRLLCGERSGRARRHEHGHLSPDEFGGECRESIELSLRKAKFQHHTLTIDIAGLLQALMDRCDLPA